MLNSYYKPLVDIELPFANRQKYMHSFDLSNITMAEGYEDYLEPVKQLCEAANATIGIAHMTVDEKIVKAGMSQRRPKPHVDGCFMPVGMYWGHNGPAWAHPEYPPYPTPTGSWGHSTPSWLHNCNNIPTRNIQRMSVIVAASVPGCRVWEGVFDGEPKNDGDLSHIYDQLGEGIVVPANKGFLLSPDCVHESMIFDHEVERSFLRIALPVDFRM